MASLWQESHKMPCASKNNSCKRIISVIIGLSAITSNFYLSHGKLRPGSTGGKSVICNNNASSFAMASLSIHSSAADALVSITRSRVYVDINQVLPSQVANPLCESSSGPSCSFVAIDESSYSATCPKNNASQKLTSLGPINSESRVAYAYNSVVHRSPLTTSPCSSSWLPEEILTDPTLQKSVAQCTEALLHLSSPGDIILDGASYADLPRYRQVDDYSWKHSFKKSYRPMGLRIESNVCGDSSGIRFPLSVLNNLNHIFHDDDDFSYLWDFTQESTLESGNDAICFLKSQNDAICEPLISSSIVSTSLPHDQKPVRNSDLTLLPVYIRLVPSGWEGHSHMLTFNGLSNLTGKSWLPHDYSYGLPPMLKPEWQGYWLLKRVSDEEVFSILPATDPLLSAASYNLLPNGYSDNEISFETEKDTLVHASLGSDLIGLGLPPLHSILNLKSSVGKLFFSSAVVISAIWIVLDLEQLSQYPDEIFGVKVSGLHNNNVSWTTKLPRTSLRHRDSKTKSSKYKLFNVMEFLEVPPQQRIDTVSFSYNHLGAKNPEGEVAAFHLLAIEVNTLEQAFTYQRIYVDKKYEKDKLMKVSPEEVRTIVTQMTASDLELKLGKTNSVLFQPPKNSDSSIGPVNTNTLKPFQMDIKHAFNLRVLDLYKIPNIFEYLQHGVEKLEDYNLQKLWSPIFISDSGVRSSRVSNTLDVRPYTESLQIYRQAIPAEAPVLSLGEVSQRSYLLCSKVPLNRWNYVYCPAACIAKDFVVFKIAGSTESRVLDRKPARTEIFPEEVAHDLDELVHLLTKTLSDWVELPKAGGDGNSNSSLEAKVLLTIVSNENMDEENQDASDRTLSIEIVQYDDDPDSIASTNSQLREKLNEMLNNHSDVLKFEDVFSVPDTRSKIDDVPHTPKEQEEETLSQED